MAPAVDHACIPVGLVCGISPVPWVWPCPPVSWTGGWPVSAGDRPPLHSLPPSPQPEDAHSMYNMVAVLLGHLTQDSYSIFCTRTFSDVNEYWLLVGVGGDTQSPAFSSYPQTYQSWEDLRDLSSLWQGSETAYAICHHCLPLTLHFMLCWTTVTNVLRS